MPLSAGTLRHRVTIEATTRTPDAAGGWTDSWAPHATVWARVEPLSGREFLEAQQAEARVSHRVTIRALDTVTPQMRVVHDSRNLHIEAVLRVNNELGEEMHLMCTEAV